MKVAISIELTDQVSEEEMKRTTGMTRDSLSLGYLDAFHKLLRCACAPGVKAEIHVTASDNTKEQKED